MKNSPTVSIVIPTYGRAEFLKKLIISVRKSTPKDMYEFVIVSSDPPETEKVRWLSKQSDVTLIMADNRKEGRRKRSLYHYTNLGIYKAKNQWVLVVNDDMKFNVKWYMNLTTLLKKHTKDNVGMIILSTHIGGTYLGYRIPVIGKIKKKSQDWKDLSLADLSLIRRDVLKKINYFDEGMDWYGSGMDNALAVEFLTKTKTILAPEIKIQHFITNELRAINAGSAFHDFNYIRRKWNSWCLRNGSRYDCDFGVAEYTLLNRFKYFCLDNFKNLKKRLPIKISRAT
ncbi:glycosyltransferase family 2 protein [Patescibacteria group bacterium]|nr:glycosyltransferase family 2 protein [Patescibacteria group bacterium]MCL5409261.1 glycosyltransferase family 2 protein [Patescibacteria group bacterium]